MSIKKILLASLLVSLYGCQAQQSAAPAVTAPAVTAPAVTAPASPVNISVMPEPGNKCLACHAVDKKIVGPAFNEVGAKYKGDKDAVSKITANVMAGGAFGWNAPMKMPPKGGTNLTDDEIKVVATFIAGLGN